jgi:hypothetical protein
MYVHVQDFWLQGICDVRALSVCSSLVLGCVLMSVLVFLSGYAFQAAPCLSLLFFYGVCKKQCPRAFLATLDHDS